MDSRAKMKIELIATALQLDGNQKQLQHGPREQQLDGQDRRQLQDANLITNQQQQYGQNHKLSDHLRRIMDVSYL